jgi:hypothetical protein
MAISCCSECTKTFEEGMDGDMPPICPDCYLEAIRVDYGAGETKKEK